MAANSSATAFAVLLVVLLLAAVATNLIGIFAVFGAFAFGAVLSDQEKLRRAASDKLHSIVTGFFVPVFFTYTGLRTDISGIARLHGVADLRRRHRRGCGGQAGRLWAGGAAERL